MVDLEELLKSRKLGGRGSHGHKLDHEGSVKTYDEMQRLLRDKDKILEIERQKEKKLKPEEVEKMKEEEVKRLLEERRNLRRKEVQDKLKKTVNKEEGHNPIARYLVKPFEDAGRGDTSEPDLSELIWQNPRIAEIMDKLLSSDEQIHGNTRRLLDLGQQLLFEAHKVGKEAVVAVKPILSSIEKQVNNLWMKEVEALSEQAQRQRRQFDFASWIAGHLGVSREKAQELLDSKQLQKEMQDMHRRLLEEPMVERTPEAAPESKTGEPWTKEYAALPEMVIPPPKQFIDKIDSIWAEAATEAESGKDAMKYADYQNYEKRIKNVINEAYPIELFPKTKDYQQAVGALYKATEEKLNALASLAAAQREKEAPKTSVGKLSKEQFLEVLNTPGQLGHFLSENPELEELLTNYEEDGVKFREQVFLRLHRGVLQFRRENTQDTFGLYERADFTTFINLLSNSMNQRTDKETGLTVGKYWAEHFTNLSNAIRLSRDIDYNASQPGQDIKGFARIAALYQNEYVQESFAIPAVAQAFRQYETSLRGIMDTYNGYIPPALVEYDAVGRTSHWDNITELMMKKLAGQKVMYDVARDPKNSYLHKIEKGGRTVEVDVSKESAERMRKMLIEEDREGLALSMYMTLAKGFGMASLRYLEIFANSRIPGSEQPFHDMPGFHSIAGYEGTASSLNFISVVFHKFKIGTYKYFHLMNMLTRDGKNLPADKYLDSKESLNAYLAYRDGTFEEKYGKDAKRLFDMFNFSKVSSALGAHRSIWRYLDSTIDWSDHELEKLGGPVRVMMAGNYADKKAKELYIYMPAKKQFRALLEKRNSELEREGRGGERFPLVGPRFDALFEQEGRSIPEIATFIRNLEWEVQGKTPEGKVLHHSEIKHEFKETVKAYKKAYSARIWVETAMRNPIVVAHNVQVDVPIAGVRESSRKMSLHKLITQQILGIPPEDMEYATVVEERDGNVYIKQKAGKYTSPTQEQLTYLYESMALEGDLATVREVAIREQRDLRPEDFDKIIDDDPQRQEKRRENARKYWDICRQAILGSTDLDRAHELYQKFGLSLEQETGLIGDYVIDWHKVEHIDDTLKKLSANRYPIDTSAGNLNITMHLDEIVNKDWDFTPGLDDLAIDQMDMLNLGSRNWFRRAAADVPAHVDGNSTMIEIFDKGILPHPDMDKLGEMMKTMVHQYGGDDVIRGYDVARVLATAIDKLYAFDIKRLGSAAQLEVWKTRMGVESWLPNERWKWWHTMEHMDVLPPHAEHFGFDVDDEFTVHYLMKEGKVMRDLIIQMLIMGLSAMTLLTVYQSLTAKSEEDEGGGH